MSSPGSPQLTLVIIYVFQPLIYEFCRLVWLNRRFTLYGSPQACVGPSDCGRSPAPSFRVGYRAAITVKGPVKSQIVAINAYQAMKEKSRESK
jgi:hypothetical protein